MAQTSVSWVGGRCAPDEVSPSLRMPSYKGSPPEEFGAANSSFSRHLIDCLTGVDLHLISLGEFCEDSGLGTWAHWGDAREEL